ncbi:MAG: response regulator transcription factor, partial [Chitinophagaceae bacterium]
IIEDEPLAAAKLREFVERIDLLSLQQVFDNGSEAVNYMLSHDTDLIFLDICMPDFDGMQLLKALRQAPKVIITSAESSYAVTGYEYNVSDYLLKPFGFDRFLKAVLKVSDELAKAQPAVTPSCIFVKTEYRNERIDLDEIRYIQGMKDYLSIVLGKRKIMTLMSFGNMLQLLPSHMFVRVHKSYIVSLDKIRSIEKSQINIEDVSIPVSDTYRELFLNLLKSRKNMI